jgi:hypothetical protein
VEAYRHVETGQKIGNVVISVPLRTRKAFVVVGFAVDGVGTVGVWRIVLRRRWRCPAPDAKATLWEVAERDRDDLRPQKAGHPAATPWPPLKIVLWGSA